MLGNAFSDYKSSSAQNSISSSTEEKGKGYWSLTRLKKSYMDYLGTKRLEIDEQKDSRRYRHGTQYTDAQIKVLNKRKQPVVTHNLIGPKINGVVGLIEKLRQAPKAFPRTEEEGEAADLATAITRYLLDSNDWKAIPPICAEDGGVDGIGGIELLVDEGDNGDPDISFECVDPESFFYDPRSKRLDFEDATFMGQGKWVDLDTAIDLAPDKEEELRDSVEAGQDLTSNPDSEQKWFSGDGDNKRVRLVMEYYKHKGGWCWALYTGNVILKEGKSPFVDEKKKTICGLIMFSGNVDQDGDRYGFVRQFKSAQDEVNARYSKALHTLNTRRIIVEKGAVDSIEKTRQEAARPDGVIEVNPGAISQKRIEFDDAARMQETETQLKFLQEVKLELDSYGPTLSLMGESSQEQSGRAIQLQQQAGISQLGPFILSYRGWKVRVYRALFNAARSLWQAERAIRVTDDENAIQFFKINQMQVDPMTGQPQMTNQIGALDVDIVLDEGPDSMNVMADTFEALQALAQAGAQVPPELLIEMSPIDAQVKKKYLDMMRQPNPMAQQKEQMEMQNAQATIANTFADAKLKEAQSHKTMMEANAPPPNPDDPSKLRAETEEKIASAQLKYEQAKKTQIEAQLLPHQHQLEQEQVAQKDREISLKGNELDLKSDENRIKGEDHKLKVAAHNSQPFKDTGNVNVGDSLHIRDLFNTVKDGHANMSSALENIAKMTAETARLAKAPRRVKAIRDPKTNRITDAISSVDE